MLPPDVYGSVCVLWIAAAGCHCKVPIEGACWIVCASRAWVLAAARCCCKVRFRVLAGCLRMCALLSWDTDAKQGAVSSSHLRRNTVNVFVFWRD